MSDFSFLANLGDNQSLYGRYAQSRALADERKLRQAQTAAAEGEARQQKLGVLRNLAYAIQSEKDPARKQQQFERFRVAAPRWLPDMANEFATVTMADIDGLSPVLTTPEQALEQQLTGAQIGYQNAQTEDIGIDNSRADWKTGADIADANRRTGIYGSGVSADIAEGRARTDLARRTAEVTGYGQVPEGQLMDPATGRAADIPGAYRKPESSSNVTYGPNGEIVITPGGKRTESQSKDLYYLNRAQSTADKLDAIDTFLTGYADKAYGMLGDAGNYLRSSGYQQADQLGDEWIASVLRKESGAAIPVTEMERYRQTYLPRPGDGPEVIAQKREARRRVIMSMRLGLGSMSAEVPENGAGIAAPGSASDPYADVDAIVGLGR